MIFFQFDFAEQAPELSAADIWYGSTRWIAADNNYITAMDKFLDATAAPRTSEDSGHKFHKRVLHNVSFYTIVCLQTFQLTQISRGEILTLIWERGPLLNIPQHSVGRPWITEPLQTQSAYVTTHVTLTVETSDVLHPRGLGQCHQLPVLHDPIQYKAVCNTLIEHSLAVKL